MTAWLGQVMAEAASCVGTPLRDAGRTINEVGPATSLGVGAES